MVEIIQGDCLKSLRNLAPKSVNTCVTSPPYFGLRDYGTAEWEGGDEGCNHSYQVKTPYNKDFNERWGNSPGQKKQESQRHEVTYKGVCKKCGAIRKDSQIGLEETPEEFVENLVKVFKEVKRVLRDDGTVWLNLGDSYISGKSRYSTKEQSILGGGNNEQKLGRLQRGGKKDFYGHPFYKDKDLAGIPWRVAFALQQDGWYLRQDIIWHKPNPMPESVRDRCTKSHEYIFLLSKSKKYYYDNEAIKEDAVTGKDLGILRSKQNMSDKYVSAHAQSIQDRKESGIDSRKAGTGKRNKRSVWTVTTKPFKGAHFAVFPMDLIEPCVLAGCPEKVCVECSEPYKRITSRNSNPLEVDDSTLDRYGNGKAGVHRKVGGQYQKWLNENPLVTVGWEKQCDCKTNETKGGIVIDPFGGSGTTGLVAQNNNRNAILLELNPEYIEIAESRLYPKQRDFLKARVVA